jgi:probable F420-dependent oxidoreductase
VSRRIEAVLPFWFDRPDLEALDIAVAARDNGLSALWVGEMATFDAMALATAAGLRAPGPLVKLGPLAIGVRSPAQIAFGMSSVAELTGSEVHVALGASSPAIVSGWHDREFAHSASRMHETIDCLRSIFAGERSAFDGEHVRSHGFKLRHPRPQTRISVAAYGPAMTRVAARYADEVVLNLVPPEQVRTARAQIDAEATAASRRPPHLAVWVPVALDPGAAAFTQLASQLAVYLAPPGYGEMFAALGFSGLVERARRGARRSELATDVTRELLDHVCALGTGEELIARISAYHDAGADVVGVVPSTANDPGGRRVLAALAGLASSS